MTHGRQKQKMGTVMIATRTAGKSARLRNEDKRASLAHALSLVQHTYIA